MITKIVLTRSHILKLKCTEIDFGWALPQNALGELTALPQTPSWIKGGLLLREGEEKGKKET